MRTRKTLVCGAAADRPQPAKPLCVVSEVTDVVLSEGSTASRARSGIYLNILDRMRKGRRAVRPLRE